AQRECEAAVETFADAIEVGAERAVSDIGSRRGAARGRVDEADWQLDAVAAEQRRPGAAGEQHRLRADRALLGDNRADAPALRLEPARGALLMDRHAV